MTDTQGSTHTPGHAILGVCPTPASDVAGREQSRADNAVSPALGSAQLSGEGPTPTRPKPRRDDGSRLGAKESRTTGRTRPGGDAHETQQPQGGLGADAPTGSEGAMSPASNSKTLPSATGDAASTAGSASSDSASPPQTLEDSITSSPGMLGAAILEATSSLLAQGVTPEKARALLAVAPELLEALSDARDILASPITAYDQHTWDVVLAKAQAAIEKVEK